MALCKVEELKVALRDLADSDDKSLAGTCLSCHVDKEEFCDRCRNYVAATIFCWGCHGTI